MVAGGFWPAGLDGKRQNQPASLSAGSPPTPPVACDTTEEELIQPGAFHLKSDRL